MKKRYFTSLVILCLLPLMSSCASNQDVQTLNYHVRSINKKLDDMKLNTVDQLQQRQADSSGLVEQIQNDLLALKSKLEENAHMNRMLQEQNKELQLAVHNLQTQQEEKMNSTIAELNSKITRQNETLTAIQQARVQDAERRSKTAAAAAAVAMQKAQAAKAARVSAASKAGSLAATTTTTASDIVRIHASSQKTVFKRAASTKATTTKSSSTARSTPKNTPTPVPTTAKPVEDHFSAAQQKYRNGDFRAAYTLFEKNASNRSNKDLSINSRYMMGECLYKQGEYDQAIIQYQQIISNYPGNPQAAKALLRQGESFEQLSDNETAKIIYKKLSRAYSNSSEAVTAKERLSAL